MIELLFGVYMCEEFYFQFVMWVRVVDLMVEQKWFFVFGVCIVVVGCGILWFMVQLYVVL